MRYWSILFGKLVAAGALLYGIWWTMHALYVPPEHVARWNHSPFLHDLNWTTMIFFYSLLCQGVLFLVILDQRYRCRTCGRRLRMPVSTGGRYSQMLLFGRPQTEYICVYGHGTLKVPEIHIGGHEPNQWEPHEDIWKELYALDDLEKK